MISIDTVYQRVQALANKEQRGYITPVEFNLFANQAQMDIFEQYFYDLNLFKKVPGSTDTHADTADIIREKINIFSFYSRTPNFTQDNDFGDYDLTDAFDNFIYRITEVSVDYTPTQSAEQQFSFVSPRVKATEVEAEDFTMYTHMLKPTRINPVWYRYTDGGTSANRKVIKVSPPPTKRFDDQNQQLNNLFVSYIKKPVKVEWNGFNVNNTFMYNAANSTDFELHASEETKIVMKILQLAAIAMKDPNLYQIATSEDIKNIQQEKQ